MAAAMAPAAVISRHSQPQHPHKVKVSSSSAAMALRSGFLGRGGGAPSSPWRRVGADGVGRATLLGAPHHAGQERQAIYLHCLMDAKRPDCPSLIPLTRLLSLPSWKPRRAGLPDVAPSTPPPARSGRWPPAHALPQLRLLFPPPCASSSRPQLRLGLLERGAPEASGCCSGCEANGDSGGAAHIQRRQAPQDGWRARFQRVGVDPETDKSTSRTKNRRDWAAGRCYSHSLLLFRRLAPARIFFMEDQDVRKSIVRISFDWVLNSNSKRVMVIGGIILSIDDDGNAVIAANSTFFGIRRKFGVNFPKDGGYENEQKLDAIRNPNNFEPVKAFESVEGFYIFTAKPRENGYIKAVSFETKSVQVGNPVYSFVFPREQDITPTGYCRGSVIAVSSGVLLHNCDMHEYGYLGSPLFNSSGDLVGITYLDQGRYQAWTVWQLQETFKHYEITMVSNGIEEPAGAEAQVEVEEPAGAEAQVEVEEPAGADAQVEE